MPCTMPPRTCSSTSSGLMTRPQSSTADRKSTRLNSSHTEIYTLSLHDALPILDAFLEQNRTDALHDAAAHLLIDQQRIDDSSAVVDRPLAEYPDEAGIAVDLDVARLHAICHVVQLVVGDEACAHRQLRVVIARQGVLPEISDAPDISEADDQLPSPAIHDLPIDNIERVGRSLGDRAGKRQDVLLEHSAGAQRRFATDGRAARRPCAAAIG